MSAGKVVVTGAGGQLGHDLVAALEAAGFTPVGYTHRDLDVTDRWAVAAAIERARPMAVVHAGAWTDVDGCESDPERAYRVNGFGTRNVVEAANSVGAYIVYVSSDYVFNGRTARAYHEWDDPDPLSVYGHSKLAGERELGGDAAVVRTSWVCGVHGKNFVRSIFAALAVRDELTVVADQRGAATFTPDLAAALVWLVCERAPGTFHVRNEGELSWYEFAQGVAHAAGVDPARVRPITTAELQPPRLAPRPANSVLDGIAWRAVGGPPLPHWRESLATMVDKLMAEERAGS